MHPRGGIDRFSKQKGVIGILAVIHLLVGLTEGSTIFNALGNQSVTQGSLFNHFSISRLEFATTAIDHHFLFGWHFFEDILLDSPKKKGTQNGMQLGNGLVLALFYQNIVLVSGTLFLLSNVAKAKPRLKDGKVIKDGRVDKI